MIKRLAIKDIKESEYNPRVSLVPGSKEYEEIKQSLIQYGLVEPPVVNEYNMTCIGGHQRLSVLRGMGVEYVDCSIVNIYDPVQEKKLCVGLNKIKGRWDDDKLEALLADDGVSDFLTGFEDDFSDKLGDEDDLEEALGEEEAPEDEENEDDDEIPEENVVIKIGSNQFRLTRGEYLGLLDSIRDMGYFDKQDIINEIQRRLVTDD